jgi:DNA repair exonuclease SbcCD ATPase subunit
MNTDKIIKSLEIKNTELNIALETYRKTKEQLDEKREQTLALEKLQNLIIDIGQKSQEEVIKYMEETVGLAIKSIFGEEYNFKIEFEMKRDQTECRFYVDKNGLLLEPRSDSLGGGIIDVAALALHVLVLILEKAPPILIIDEPQLKNVSKGHLPEVAEMVSRLVKMLDIQLIMVSHIPEMIDIADNIIEI